MKRIWYNRSFSPVSLLLELSFTAYCVEIVATFAVRALPYHRLKPTAHICQTQNLRVSLRTKATKFEL